MKNKRGTGPPEPTAKPSLAVGERSRLRIAERAAQKANREAWAKWEADRTDLEAEQPPIAVRLPEARERLVDLRIALRNAETRVEGIKAQKREAEEVVARLLAEQSDGEQR